MTLVISIFALIVAAASIIVPVVDKDLRRAYIIVKHSKAIDIFKGKSNLYNEFNIPLNWFGTVYHLRNDIVNRATHTLQMYFLEMEILSEVVFYVNLKDYQCFAENNYKLLIEDPRAEVWTHFFELERNFVEENLDKLIRVEAEIVSKEKEDGLMYYQESTRNNYIIKPIKVEATGIPTLLYDYGRR